MEELDNYCMSRLNLAGSLTKEMVGSALGNPKPVFYYGSAWSFFDVSHHSSDDGHTYYTGKLSRYDPEATVTIADPSTGREKEVAEPNLRRGSSNFIYIPYFSALAFTKFRQDIDEHKFSGRFCRIIKNTYDDVLVDCWVDYISDVIGFSEKILTLDRITNISAVVKPPNPLFGSIWKPLRDYLRGRNTSKMLLREESTNGQLVTKVGDVAKAVVDMNTSDRFPESRSDLAPTDAAVFLAADGYGTATVRGVSGSIKVQIKTSDWMMSFSVPKESDPLTVYKAAWSAYSKIESERRLEHE